MTLSLKENSGEHKKKAEVLGRAFVAVHSGNHLSKIHKRQKELALREKKEVKMKKENGVSTLWILQCRNSTYLIGTGYTAPGQDQLCYAMFRQIPVESSKLVLRH